MSSLEGRLRYAASMETTPYIGQSISLVSKAGIRYEGTLFTIDTEASNLALQNGAPGRLDDAGGNESQLPAALLQRQCCELGQLQVVDAIGF